MNAPKVRPLMLRCAIAALACAGIVRAETPEGSIVGWGDQVVGVDLSHGFIAVAAGGEHSLGLKADGSIVAWGDNEYGQTNVPVPNTGFVGVAAGGAHSLGLKADGSIVAWGSNWTGQSNFPAPNADFIGIAAGLYHSLGLKGDGSIVGWGYNDDGQTNVPAPNSGFVGVAAGMEHSLGLKADGSIVAWGNNNSGQTNVPAPNANFIGIAAGGAHSLGLKADGSIVAWGRNNYGQTDVPAPNADFIGVAAGGSHTLGLKADGSIVAWGGNYWGQTNVPAHNSGFVAIAGGYYHSLGLKGDGSIVAWGNNDSGQTTDVPAPNTGFVGVAAGMEHSLGLKADGSIVAWGRNNYGQTDVPAPNADFIGVAAGGGHSLGLKPDGSIIAWGGNSEGQINVPAPNTGCVGIAAGESHSLCVKGEGSIICWGDNTYRQCDVPAPNADFIGVAAGWYHSLGLKSDGSIVAWGDNEYGQTNVPVPNTGFVGVAAGGSHTLGLKGDGSIVGWGYNDDGQTNVPAPNSGFVGVAGGAFHSLGLKADGSIVAWGSNQTGQTNVPAPNTGFVGVAAGGWHSLAVRGNVRASACVGSYVGTYSGASSGTLQAYFDCNSTISFTFISYFGNVDFRSVVTVQPDGTVLGSFAGATLNGTFDYDDCTASGTWVYSGYSGTWNLVRSEPGPCVAPLLTVAPSQLTVGKQAGLSLFAVSNTGAGSMSWTAGAVGNPTWLRTAPNLSGVNGGFVVVQFDENPDPGPRVGTIRVTAPAAVPSYGDVTVVQAGTAPPPRVTHFEFSPLPGPYMVNEPIPVTITAMNATNTAAPQIQTAFNGEVSLSTNAPCPLSLNNKIVLANGVGSGTVKCDQGFIGTVLNAHATGGLSGQSTPFAILPPPGSAGCVSGSILGPFLALPDVRVTVTGDDGSAQEAEVTVRDSNPPGLLSASYRACGLAPGTYIAHAVSGQWRSLRKKITIRGEAKVWMPLTLLDSAKPPVLLVGGILGSRQAGQAWLYPVIAGEPGSPEPSDLELIDRASSPNVWEPLRVMLSPHFTTIDLPWDWRASITPKTVDKYLLPILDEASGLADKVHVVAHSAGGLLVRQYIQGASYPQRQHIDRFAMVGTPNEGAAILYYLWEGADPKLADTIPYPQDDLYRQTVEKIYSRIKGKPLYQTVCTRDLAACLEQLTIQPHTFLDFIRRYLPSTGDMLMTRPFLTHPGDTAPFAAAGGPPWSPIVDELRNSPAIDRLVSETDPDAARVRTKLFLSNSLAPEHAALKQIVVSTMVPGDGRYVDGTPTGSLRRGAGDGTVLYYKKGDVGLGSVSLDDSRLGKHGELLGVYADAICTFLNNGTPCAPTVASTASGPEGPTSFLSLSFDGRVQPYVVDPTGVGTGVAPGGNDIVQQIAGSFVEVTAMRAGVLVPGPVSGEYAVQLTAVPEDVYAVNVEYADGEATKEIGFRGIYHAGVASFTVAVDPQASPPIALIPSVQPPVNVRAERVNGLARIAWDASLDPAVTGYNLYGKPDDQPKFTLLGSTAGTTLDTGHPWVSQGVGALWNYFVLAEVADGTESLFDTVVENRSPLIAGMVANVTCGLEPLSASFTDASAGEVSAWAWDFDSDGVIDSTEPSPTHLFETPGSYTVTLTVGGPEGTDTGIRVGFITVYPASGDVDGDRDVDLDDFKLLRDKLLGPGVEPGAVGWEIVDFDDDLDVDLRDFALFQNVFVRCP